MPGAVLLPHRRGYFHNERGKGDHRHRDGLETPYRFTSLDQLHRFTSLDQLLADFETDAEALRKEKGENDR